MAFKTLITPNFGAQNYAGNCLPLAQSVVGAGGGPVSATQAANATRFQHWDRAFPPNALCAVWLSHYGTYTNYTNGQLEYGDWGHVVIWSPSAFGVGQGGFYSSPQKGYGGEWFRSIAEVEAAFNSTYRFWSEDLNGIRVCQKEEEIVTPQDIERVAQRTAQLLLDTKVAMQGSKKGQTKTLRQLIAWNDHQWASIKRPLEWLTKVGPKIAAKLGVK